MITHAQLTADNYDRRYEDIAVIGISGRFPGAASVAEFWQNIRDGVECISFFSPEQLRAAGVPEKVLSNPAYVPAKGYLADWDQFDGAFFGYSRREATLMDPQIRILHECAWEALEDAGYAPDCAGDVGVYIGGSSNPYWFCLTQQRQSTPSEQYQAVVLNDNQSFSTRLSYKLGLTGPSFTLQTACSSSLVALHVACRALIARECRMALTGGVSILFPAVSGYLHEPGMVTSPDGHCRAFDAQGQGTLAGDGCGLVVLKLLEHALTDGDHIYAVVKGTAINNDGHAKLGYTAPSVAGQADVIREAHRAAGIDPSTISYLECHGTATPLGDPIELAALIEAFGPTAVHSCAIGSLKTNLGHLNHAAGIAGFIKTVLALNHRMLPSSLHFEEPNPEIDFSRSAFYVNKVSQPWQASGPLRAGVSSFGIGGTNAHAVLEEAPRTESRPDNSGSSQLLLLSARTEAALEVLTDKLRAHLLSHPSLDIPDVAYTLQSRVRPFPFRRAVLYDERSKTLDELAARSSDRCWTGASTQTPRTIVYLLPGQGSQYHGLGHGLYESMGEYRETVDTCLEHVSAPLKDELAAVFRAPDRLAAEAINETRLAQPALFICEFACAALLKKLGLTPALLLGHSLGEITAACLAGVFSLEEALRLVVLRAELMQSLPSGAMLSVDLSPEHAAELLSSEVSLAAINGPRRCVLSGTHSGIGSVEQQLLRRGLACRHLATSHAFHSVMMEPILDQFTNAVARCQRQTPAIPFLSNVTGKWIKPEEATAPEYWARQLRDTVQFRAGIDLLFGIRNPCALEVGPGNALSSMVQRCNAARKGLKVVNLLRRAGQNRKDQDYFLERIGKLWVDGVDLDFSALHCGARRRRVSLPAYPFERQRLPAPDDLRLTQEEPSQLYLPLWRRKAGPLLAPKKSFAGTHWLLFVPSRAAECIAERLRVAGAKVVTVEPGERFRRVEPGKYEINSLDRNDYARLIAALDAAGFTPSHMVHAWSLAFACNRTPSIAEFRSIQEHGFYSLLNLAQALARKPGAAIDLYVLTRDATAPSGSSLISPAQATLPGLATVISQESTSLRCHTVDVSGADLDRETENGLLASLIEKLFASPALAAYRRGELWEPDYMQLSLQPQAAPLVPTRQQGVYVINGGLGELGMIIAESLFRSARAKLVLLTHPAGENNDDAREPQLDSRRSRFLERLRSAGAEVLTLTADCANKEQMENALQQAEARFGMINGVIHAAAVTRTSSISTPAANLRVADCEEQFRTKVQGAIVLRELLDQRRPDFVLLMSSLASVLGGLGFGAYAAANSFLDAAAQAWSHESGTRWIAVNWDAWETPENGRPKMNSSRLRSLTVDEGLEALSRILAYDGPAQVLVSATDLAQRRRHWTTEIDGPVVEKRSQLLEITHENTIKEQLATFFKDLFAAPAVSFDESFADLGGDSLMAVTLVSRINHAFAVRLQVSDLLEGQTIDRLAAQISDIKRRASRPSLCRAEEREYYPLSFAQQGILASRNLVYDSRFNCSGVLKITGAVDVQRLERALRTLVNRHEILRTVFDVEQARQQVMKKIDFRLEVVDCSPVEANAVLEQFVRPFVVHELPLLRAKLVRIAGDSSRLLLDLHHAITDGISLDLMIAELWSIYDGEPLPEVPLQYRDYAVWQNRMARAGAFDQDRRFWVDAMRDYIWTELPVDANANTAPAFGQRLLEVSPGVVSELLAFCKQQRITLMTLLTAAVYRTIETIAGQNDITIGVRVSRRTEAMLERMPGPFVEDAVCRLHVPERSSSENVLTETGRVLAAILDRNGYPYEHLNEQLQQTRPTPNGELFTIMLNQLPPIADQCNSSLKSRFTILPRPLASKYYLNLRLRPGRGLQLDAKYRSDKYSISLIDHFLQSIVDSANSLCTAKANESLHAVA